MKRVFTLTVIGMVFFAGGLLSGTNDAEAAPDCNDMYCVLEPPELDDFVCMQATGLLTRPDFLYQDLC